MKQITNAEKQARFRKKEALKHRANHILINWEINDSKHHLKGPNEIRELVEEAIKLPSGWTDEDYSNAERKLDNIYWQTVYPADQLQLDIRETRRLSNENSNPSNLRKAQEDADALALHIISALKLSSCNDADRAAALMQAIRFVGRNLSGDPDAPCSQATSICLASIGSNYDRPSWLPKKLANDISLLFQPELLNEIVSNLEKQ